MVEQENVIAEYYDLKEKIAVYEQDMKDVMNHPNYCLSFIQPGRLVRIKHDKRLYRLGSRRQLQQTNKAICTSSKIVSDE